MPKFRKKPVVIEAEQFRSIAHYKRGWPLPKGVEWDDDEEPFIRTLEGNMRVDEGDWIITGVKGEKYPCKPDIFEQTYEWVG